MHLPDSVVQYDTSHTHELASEYPELHAAQSPSWSHLVHPVLFPLVPQHLPPLQFPDLHEGGRDEQEPPSETFVRNLTRVGSAFWQSELLPYAKKNVGLP